MSIHREGRPGGKFVYKVRWRQGGRQRARVFNPDRLGGARAARKIADRFDQQMAELAATGDFSVVDRGTITFAAYTDLWWERYARQRLAESTQEAYATTLDVHILPTFGTVALREIKPGDIEDWIVTLRRRKVGDPTILKACAVMQGVLKRAVRDREIDSNPATQVDKPRQQRKRRPMIIDPKAVEAIRAHMLSKGQVGDATLVSVLAYAGPRPESEAITLQWSQVGKKALTVRDTKHHGIERQVRLLSPLAEDLVAWRGARGLRLRGLVFPFHDGHVAPEGKAWTGDSWDNWRERVFLPAAKAAGLPVKAPSKRTDRKGKRPYEGTAGKEGGVRPRDLRSTLVSLLIWEGRTVVEIAAQLGHAPTMTLNTYAGIFEEYDPADRKPAEDVIREARAATPTPEEATGS